jgi:hypothetical protein
MSILTHEDRKGVCLCIREILDSAEGRPFDKDALIHLVGTPTEFEQLLGSLLLPFLPSTRLQPAEVRTPREDYWKKLALGTVGGTRPLHILPEDLYYLLERSDFVREQLADARGVIEEIARMDEEAEEVEVTAEGKEALGELEDAKDIMERRLAEIFDIHVDNVFVQDLSECEDANIEELIAIAKLANEAQPKDCVIDNVSLLSKEDGDGVGFDLRIDAHRDIPSG